MNDFHVGTLRAILEAEQAKLLRHLPRDRHSAAALIDVTTTRAPACERDRDIKVYANVPVVSLPAPIRRLLAGRDGAVSPMVPVPEPRPELGSQRPYLGMDVPASEAVGLSHVPRLESRPF